MKILVLGDPHFRLTYPYADRVSDGRRKERDDLYAFLHDQAKDCDAVVLMGDNLDKRHNHSSVIKEFVTFLEGFGEKDLYIISGNHETYEGNKTAIDFLKGRQSNWNVMTAGFMHCVKSNEANLAFIPYQNRASLFVDSDEAGAFVIAEYIEEHGPHDIVFTHHAVSGTKAIGGMTDMFNEIVLPRERIEASTKLLVAGHIHQASRTGNTLVTGSLMTQEIGEEGKSAWKLTIGEEIEVEEIPLPVRPILKVEVSKDTTEGVLAQLDSLPKNSIIKFINHDKSIDVEAVKERLGEFDGHVVLEDYPSERKRLNVDEKQTMDLSIPSLLTLYAESRGKDPQRLQEAFKIIQDT